MGERLTKSALGGIVAKVISRFSSSKPRHIFSFGGVLGGVLWRSRRVDATSAGMSRLELVLLLVRFFITVAWNVAQFRVFKRFRAISYIRLNQCTKEEGGLHHQTRTGTARQDAV